MLAAKDASINIKPDAKKIIDKKIGNKSVLILALDDGSNKFSKRGGTCTIGADFQIVALDQKSPDFSISVKNNAGYNLFTSKNELNYLDSGLVINNRGTSLSLSADSGVLDGALAINVYQPKNLTAKDYQEGQSC